MIYWRNRRDLARQEKVDLFRVLPSPKQSILMRHYASGYIKLELMRRLAGRRPLPNDPEKQILCELITSGYLRFSRRLLLMSYSIERRAATDIL